MASLQVIRRRIRSVQNTQKITRAMQMVAGSKLRRSQGELVGFKPYARALEAIARRFLAAHPALEHPLLGGEKEGAPVGLLVVTSDTGLCGTYNERVSSLSGAFLKEHPSAQVVVIGKKGNRAFVRRGIGRVKEILDWGGRYDASKAQELLTWIEERYVKGEISSWWIATTQFISALSFKPVVERFLPIAPPSPLEGEGKGEGLPEKVISEPDQASVAQELLGRFLRAKFARILLEACTCEHSARMIAMKNATDNAGEMVEHLTLVRNKVRQAAITKELIEVVSGAEALK